MMRAIEGLSAGLYVSAYLLAVIDGTTTDKGLFPSSPGRTEFKPYTRTHPWIIAGAGCGIAGVVVDFCFA